MAESASAQSITKPSVPEFTVKYVDNSYDVPPVYEKNNYTGNYDMTKMGEREDNRTLEITIKNQPFTPFTDASSGKAVNLFYNVRYKGSFGQDWRSMFGERVDWLTDNTFDPYLEYGYPAQDSSSEYTTIVYHFPWNIVAGQMDIQVEALQGYTERGFNYEASNMLMTVYKYTFYGQESGWSTTQTITIGEETSMPPPSSTQAPSNSTSITDGNPLPIPTSDPTQPVKQTTQVLGLGWEQTTVVVAVIVIVVLAVTVILLCKRSVKGGN